MNNYLFSTICFLSLFCIVTAKYGSVQREEFCGAPEISIKCSNANEGLKVVYGAFAPSSNHCDQLTHSKNYVACQRRDLTADLKNRCNGVQGCTVNIDSLLSGNDCPDEAKHAIVKYKCIQVKNFM